MHLVDNETQEQNQDHAEPLAPVVHMIHFKSRRVLVCRGENALGDAVARGFKRVTSAHFHKYVADAKKGFRQKGSKRK